MSVTRLSGGLTPGNGGDPRTFPAIWNGTADGLEAGDYSKVPTGGAAGEVLGKVSGTDYDGAWVVRSVPWTPISGTSYGAAASTSLTTTLDLLYFIPVYFPIPTSVDQVRANNLSTTDVGQVIRLGLYLPSLTGGPGALIVDAGTAEAAAAGVKSITISQVVEGLVWLAVVSQVAVCSIRSAQASSLPYESSISPAGATALNQRSCPTQSSVSGALPSTAAPDGSTLNVPIVHLRVA
jgi:hypothetical protein